MGFNGSKKKKKAAEEARIAAAEERKNRRKSRRVVAPSSRQEVADDGDVSSQGSSRLQRSTRSNLKSVSPDVTAAVEATDDFNADMDLELSPEEKALAASHQDKDEIMDLDLVAPSQPAASVANPDSDLLDASGFEDLAPTDSPTAGVCRTGELALIDFLVNKASLVDQGQADALRMKAQNESKPLDVVAVEAGFFTEDEMVNALTQECWVPHLKVEKYAIRKKALDAITEEDARYFGVLPVDKLGTILNLAMVNPLDAETIRALEDKTGLDIKKVVATRHEIEQGIAKYYGDEAEVTDASMKFSQDMSPQRPTQMIKRVESESPEQEVAPEIAAATTQAVSAPAANDVFADDVDDIMDIDDLLGDDFESDADVIQPSVIEPISISDDMFMDEEDDNAVQPVVTSSYVRTPSNAGASSNADVLSSIESAPLAPITEPSLTEPIADVFAEDEAVDDFVANGSDTLDIPDVSAAPADLFQEEVAAVAEPERSFVEEPIAQVSAPVPAAASIPPAPEPAQPAITQPPVQEKPTLVDLIPVGENEFQQAISSNKSRVFEKWIAIQTRDRILNARPVRAELDEVLAPLVNGADSIPANV